MFIRTGWFERLGLVLHSMNGLLHLCLISMLAKIDGGVPCLTGSSATKIDAQFNAHKTNQCAHIMSSST